MRDVHSGEWNSDRVLRGFIGPGDCLGDGYDQRRIVRQPDEPVRNERRVRRICLDVSGIRPADDDADPGVCWPGLFEPHHFVGAILPFLIGFALGNLDHDLRDFFSKATPVLIPFFGFALGNTINLKVILDTGLLGIVLGVAVIVITGIPLIIADRVIGEETARRASPPLQPQGLPSQTR
jgi:hypothetical protein